MLIAIKRVLYICHLVYVVFFALHGVRSGMEHLQPPEALILSAETEDVLGAVQSGKCLDKKKIQVLLHWRGKKCVDRRQRRILVNVYANSGPQGPEFQGETDEKRSESRQNIASSQYLQKSKQHMKSLKDESSKVEKVDSVDGSGR
ncbi:hypothetical protein ACROYT_G025554 [Oculina patagonica]